jgi:hypothetical protein
MNLTNRDNQIIKDTIDRGDPFPPWRDIGITLNTTTADVRKITVASPVALLARLDEWIPSRSRSRFILEAIEERLAIEEQLAALD